MKFVEPPIAGDEAAALTGELDRVRSIFWWKCAGLDAEGMRTTLGPSTMSLGGLVKHMALVEDTHFARLLLARTTPPPPWDKVDFDADPDWEWRTAADDTPEQLFAQWDESVARSRQLVADAMVDGGPDHRGGYVTRSGERPNLRRVILDMVEEYARHAGHADLIREAVDGLVGEQPED